MQTSEGPEMSETRVWMAESRDFKASSSSCVVTPSPDAIPKYLVAVKRKFLLDRVSCDIIGTQRTFIKTFVCYGTRKLIDQSGIDRRIKPFTSSNDSQRSVYPLFVVVRVKEQSILDYTRRYNYTINKNA
jgi:hypothetical protein